jgi:uncharacterized OB-fold protein
VNRPSTETCHSIRRGGTYERELLLAIKKYSPDTWGGKAERGIRRTPVPSATYPAGRAAMSTRIPVVNYLVLDGGYPHLVATECTSCQARYFGTRIACSRCGGQKFVERPLATAGTLGSFSIIHRAAGRVKTPFISAVVDLEDGTAVKANLIDCPPDPDHVRLGMKVILRTFEAGVDDSDSHAIAFGFAPATEDDQQ